MYLHGASDGPMDLICRAHARKPRRMSLKSAHPHSATDGESATMRKGCARRQSQITDVHDGCRFTAYILFISDSCIVVAVNSLNERQI